MATDTKTQIPTIPFVDQAAADKVVARIQSFNQQVLDTSKKAGQVSLDTFEQAVRGCTEIEEKVAASSQFDFVTAAVTSHVKFVKDFSGAYVSAAREALK
jgi:hypothetical protein